MGSPVRRLLQRQAGADNLSAVLLVNSIALILTIPIVWQVK
jgi:hypothetical protein